VTPPRGAKGTLRQRTKRKASSVKLRSRETTFLLNSYINIQRKRRGLMDWVVGRSHLKTSPAQLAVQPDQVNNGSEARKIVAIGTDEALSLTDLLHHAQVAPIFVPAMRISAPSRTELPLPHVNPSRCVQIHPRRKCKPYFQIAQHQQEDDGNDREENTNVEEDHAERGYDSLALEFGDNKVQSALTPPILENVFTGQLQALSSRRSDTFALDGDSSCVFTTPPILEGRGVVRCFGARALVVPVHSDWFSPVLVHRWERQAVAFLLWEINHRIIPRRSTWSDPGKKSTVSDFQGLLLGVDVEDLINYCVRMSSHESSKAVF
ncbi:SWI/SNF complex subunit SWI3C, partial [Mucuna pruriens]